MLFCILFTHGIYSGLLESIWACPSARRLYDRRNDSISETIKVEKFEMRMPIVVPTSTALKNDLPFYFKI